MPRAGVLDAALEALHVDAVHEELGAVHRELLTKMRSVVQATTAVAGFVVGMYHLLDDKTVKL